LAAAGARRVLCVNQQIGNQGLDARCRGLARAMRAAGGRSHVLGVDDQSPSTPRKIADAIRSGRIDGVLALNATSGIEAVKGARQLGGTARPKIATFDLDAQHQFCPSAASPAALRGRSAGLSAGLPADRPAHRARALRVSSSLQATSCPRAELDCATAGKAMS
jgi:simple sugar transport system substrate-binding protein